MSRPERSGERTRLHALVLHDPEKTLRVLRRLRSEGYAIDDVHSPFPVHGMAEAMGLAPSRVSTATLAGASFGLLFAFGLQAWTSVVDWPLNIGGKSYLALPALVPVLFELSVLCAAFATVAALVGRSRLRPRGMAPPSQPGANVTDDRFVIVIREDDARFDPVAFRTTATLAGADELIEGWKVF